MKPVKKLLFALTITLSACTPSDNLDLTENKPLEKEKMGYKSYARAKQFYTDKSVIPTNGGYAFYLSKNGILTSVPQNKKFTADSTSLSDISPITIGIVTGKSFKGRPHKNGFVNNTIPGKEAICSQKKHVLGDDDPICLPLYHDAEGKLFEPAFTTPLIVLEGPDAFKAAARDYISEGNSSALYDLAEAFPEDAAIANELSEMIAHAKQQKADRLAAKEAEDNSKPSGSSGSGLLGAFILGTLNAMFSPAGSQETSNNTNTSSFSPKYGCQFYCQGSGLTANKSGTITANTPATNSSDAQDYIRREYTEFCSKNFPYHGTGSGTGAHLSYANCETWFYKD